DRAFTAAKALWQEKGLSEEDKIREHLSAVIEESHFGFAKETILGLIDERKGQTASALDHALRAQILTPRPMADDSVRIDHWIARLQILANQDTQALASLRTLIARKKGEADAEPAASSSGLAGLLGVPPVPARLDLIMSEGELLSKMGRWGEAAA